MTLIRPFEGWLPDPDLAGEVVTPPLAGLTVGEWMSHATDNPHSFINVIRSEVDTSEGGPVPGADDGTSGRERLAEMIEEGVIRGTGLAAFYVYAIEGGAHDATGLVAEVDVADYPAGRIRRHELTRTPTEELLVDHLRRIGAQSDPVSLTYRADDSIAAIIGEIVQTAPDIDFTAAGDVRQRVWVVDDDRTIQALGGRLATVQTLYVTDGHHRCAAAARYARYRRRRNPGHRGDEAYNYVLAALFPDDQLALLEFNRCVTMTVDEADIAAIGAALDVERLDPSSDPRPQRKGSFGLVVGNARYRIDVPTELIPDDVYDSLDAVLLQRLVLGPVLGIDDPRTDPHLRYVAGPEPPDIEALGYPAAFVLHPTSVDEVMAVADAGLVMPPKSTWFEPKVWGGLFVRPLDSTDDG